MSDRTFHGVIFDFNGVLLWDNELHEEAWRRYSARLRGTPLTLEEMKVVVHGRTNRDIFDYVLGRPVTDEELRPMLVEKETIYQGLAIEAGEAYRLSPGAIELLDYLAANHIPRAIATSSPEINIGFFIEHLDLLRWFGREAIVYDRGLYPGKPAPDIYLEAAERLGLPPAQCVVVEDSIAGTQSAAAAGIGATFAIGPAETREELATLPGVVAVIEKLGEFPRPMLIGRMKDEG